MSASLLEELKLQRVRRVQRVGEAWRETHSPSPWPEWQSTAAALPSFYGGSRWLSWPWADIRTVNMVPWVCVCAKKKKGVDLNLWKDTVLKRGCKPIWLPLCSYSTLPLIKPPIDENLMMSLMFSIPAFISCFFKPLTSRFHSACVGASWTSADLLPTHPAQDTAQFNHTGRRRVGV